ncbi:acetyl-CoA carboxylase biotin carboxyl carrier protein subunit [Porphyromonas uenonis]|uniref:acetyl-CoA carboxylase biotin carboxyl carrier protein subunit n=1 Tax=Porphyromonas uenonis TaxID=281920 RepID=UPI000470C714|nr:acetyl-CoA carboxylase biotin carboxyl carrier protein subunit [Porphyromonas uenonis]
MKEYKYKIDGKEYAVKIDKIEGDQAQLEVNGTPYSVEIIQEKKETPKVAKSAPKSAPAATAAPAPAAAPASSGKGKAVKAPLPGVIISVDVQVGQQVKRGQQVAVLEAMKMENGINAECDGTITEIKVKAGDSILEGTDILIIG